MRPFRAWLVRLRATLRPGRRDRELADELNGHIEFAIEENIRAGMTRDEAHRRAAADLGGITATVERCREHRGLQWIESLGRDLSLGVRRLKKHPGFSIIAIATLAVCIAVNTAVYTLVDFMLIRPVPYPSAFGI